MPNLNEEYQLMRKSQVLQVFLAVASDPDLTVEQACDKIGISKSIYYSWLRRDDSAIAAVRELINDSQRQMLAELVNVKVRGMSKLMEQAISDDMNPRDRVLVLKYIDDELDNLQSVHHAKPGIEEDARTFLKSGPTTKTQDSRLTSFEVRSTPEGDGIRIDVLGPDGQILDVEDAEFQDQDNESQTRSESDHHQDDDLPKSP